MIAETFGTLGSALKSISELTQAIKSGQQKQKRGNQMLTKKKRAVMPHDLRVMSRVWAAISPLNERERDRVVKWVWEKNEELKKTLFDLQENEKPIEKIGTKIGGIFE